MLSTSPKLLKAGLVLIDSESGGVVRVVPMQYNPEKLSRSLQAQYVESQQGDRSEALRITGPPVETIKLEALIDATDYLETPDQAASRNVLLYGVHPQLAALETILYPSLSSIRQNNSKQKAGSLEISPVVAPLTVFVWGSSRIAPVRLTDFSIDEQFFDPNLNPIRATVSLGMRVLTMNDLGFNHPGANIFMVYQQQKEKFAQAGLGGSLGTMGVGGAFG